MLLGLHVRDLALIEAAEIRLDAGLNVISGETGGGKSLVLKAIELLCGAKASASLVRHGAAELRVDGEFEIGDGERSRGVSERVEALVGAPIEDGLLVLSRIVDRGGRSKARVNGRPATLAVLRELASWLVEIHGQGEARALMRPEIQAETLDAFAGTTAIRERFATALVGARTARDRLDALRSASRERLQRAEYLRFQCREIGELGLEAGEFERLEAEHKILAHLDHIREELERAVATLIDADPAAGDLVARAARAVEAAAEADGELSEPAAILHEIQIQIDEVGRRLQSRLGDLDLDPARLEVVETRLAEVRRALGRWGPTVADLFENAAAFRAELETLDGGDDEESRLATALREAIDVLVTTGRKLQRARCKAAAAFDRAIAGELDALGMPGVRFEVETDVEVDPATILDRATMHGPAPVEFVVRINPGEPAKPLRETASGGEAARIVLAVKKCLADQDRVPFLAFDEIDAEIGGRLGLAVGRKLVEVSADHQLLIVTHLPQVAAFGAAHFKVSKAKRGDRTVTEVERLDAPAIERELAAMAGAEGADSEAVAEARRLVARVRASAREAGG